MKLLLAALAVTFTIAVTASVFAIWPAVADAPWEDEIPTPVVVEDTTNALRCQGRLDIRERALFEASGPEALEILLKAAQAEIDRYC